MRAPDISYADEIDALRLSRSLLKAAQAHFGAMTGPPSAQPVWEALEQRIWVLEGLIQRAIDRERGVR